MLKSIYDEFTASFHNVKVLTLEKNIFHSKIQIFSLSKTSSQYESLFFLFPHEHTHEIMDNKSSFKVRKKFFVGLKFILEYSQHANFQNFFYVSKIRQNCREIAKMPLKSRSFCRMLLFLIKFRIFQRNQVKSLSQIINQTKLKSFHLVQHVDKIHTNKGWIRDEKGSFKI